MSVVFNGNFIGSLLQINAWKNLNLNICNSMTAGQTASPDEDPSGMDEGTTERLFH